MSILTANDWVKSLSKGTKQAFQNIKRNDVVSGLKDRLAAPKRIAQANTSLCGPACFMYCVASLKSDSYAGYVTTLYEVGAGSIGKLLVQPGDDCKEYAPSTSSGIHPVDWVALASLRDSENDAFDYDAPSDEAGGITMPEDLLDWFIQAGFCRGANITNLVFTKSQKEIEDASTRFYQYQSVCLFINANMLQNPSSQSWTPDHWVVLTSPITIKKDNINFEVYSWGSIQKVDTTVNNFCKNFYGYISSSST
jgi:hypothetical protein